jgi:glycosyltransferase involved in cell wall biosynthesis
LNVSRLTIFISFSGHGGVERMVLNLAGEFLAAGHEVDLVLVRAEGEHLKALPVGARVVKLSARHTWTSLWPLLRYLRRERPDAILAAKDRAMRVAVLARALSGCPARLVGRLGTTISAALEGRSRMRRMLWFAGMRMFYRHLDAIVAVSEGVADDVRAITGLSADKVRVIRNPVVTPQLAELAAEPVVHPWLAPAGPPVLIGIGRLTRQKDFATLVRAFAQVHRQRRVRLIILGDGHDKERLIALAEKEGVAEDFHLAGFQANPYAWLARASLFVLSSRWEGSPNALTEAMALGIPVVSTDCRSGPRELLDGGRFGPLVPVGNADELAQAILDVLERPPRAEALRATVQEYRSETSARRYLDLLCL